MQDYNEYVMPGYNLNVNWDTLVTKILKGENATRVKGKGILYCPTLRGKGIVLDNLGVYSTYTYNVCHMGTSATSIANNKFPRFQKPEKCPLLADARKPGTPAATHQFGSPQDFRPITNSNFARLGGYHNGTDWNTGYVNVLFLGGNVRSILYNHDWRFTTVVDPRGNYYHIEE